ncbi:MAG: S46 family peptidase [Flavobacteriales bacterium]
MKNLKRLFLSILMLCSLNMVAKEGMWLPMFLQQLNETEMQAMGLELTAEDIYSINNGSLKDAIVHFGGGCTAEVISGEGLLLTNHHCGYGQIQSHSSVENDYLSNGFWAKDRSEELTNEGLTATFIKYMKEVTADVLLNETVGMREAERREMIKSLGDSLISLEIEGTHYEAMIKPFFKGNRYFMFVTETYTDVRLVGAPPSSIGKFGSDTDNWMWPRHTGDFSIFRIYADKDNNPAEYSEDNIPYTPNKHLNISTQGVKPGDFTMVYGFPGRTDEYLPAVAVKQITQILNPAKISIRKTALEIMDKEMRASDEVRIKYASKYASVANYYKKWIGENTGIQKTQGLKRKREFEQAFMDAVNSDEKYADYAGLLAVYDSLYGELEDIAMARDYFIEIAYRGVAIVNFANKVSKFVETGDAKDLERFKKSINGHFKNYDAHTDELLFDALFKKYELEQADSDYLPAYFNGKTYSANEVFSKSYFASQEKLEDLLNSSTKKVQKKLSKDPAFKVASALYGHYRNVIYGKYWALEDELDAVDREYLKAMMEVLPDYRNYYPDANSTLRLTYGQVQGVSPLDAVSYGHITYLEGMMEKYVPGDYEFDLPEKLIELYDSKDFGPYADDNGKLPVCFIATNHTTGGNSGSPALNAKGELVGLNFDRAWEGTMSDINYDASRCRNIMVDARYVLFIIDKFAGAGYLLDEMTIK